MLTAGAGEFRCPPLPGRVEIGRGYVLNGQVPGPVQVAQPPDLDPAERASTGANCWRLCGRKPSPFEYPERSGADQARPAGRFPSPAELESAADGLPTLCPPYSIDIGGRPENMDALIPSRF